MTIPRLPVRVLLAAMAAAWIAVPALAQYKVVGPDGKVTYTDRPAAAEPGAQVQPFRRDALAAAPAGPPLPTELRTLTTRFPVTLYTSTDCQPCDNGRKLLQQRGVPYSERVVGSDDDIAALQRLTGSRTVPSLTVGSQALRGLLESDWHSTLDLAGYPKESKLPRGWQPPAPAPVVARSIAEASPAPNARTTAEPPAPTAAPAGQGGIRF